MKKSTHYKEMAELRAHHQKNEELLREQILMLAPKMSNHVSLRVCLPSEFEEGEFYLRIAFKVDKNNSETARRQALELLMQRIKGELAKFLLDHFPTG